MHPTIIEIDQMQLQTNLALIRQFIGANRKFLLPVKANAYGHGITLVAKIAQPYVDYFGVACLDEGVTLRKAGIKKPILVFGPVYEEQVAELIQYDLEITISSLYKAQLVNELCTAQNKSCKVHIKVDVGMNRVGVKPQTVPELMEYILANKGFKLVGIYSHLAMSEDPDTAITQEQIKKFGQVIDFAKQLKPDLIYHLANSGGVCYHPASLFDMVRPGILSYGYFPGKVVTDNILAGIKPCFSLKSMVSYFKVVQKESGISYNHIYHTTHDTRVVTIPIGYGDGYRRGLSNSGEVLLHGNRYKIVGNICMDMLMVDIGRDGTAYVGDEVVLIGKQGSNEIALTELADKLNTTVYEVLVSFNERIPRTLCL